MCSLLVNAKLHGNVINAYHNHNIWISEIINKYTTRRMTNNFYIFIAPSEQLTFIKLLCVEHSRLPSVINFIVFDFQHIL